MVFFFFKCIFEFKIFIFLFQQLKKNLSTAALKGFRCGDSSTPVKSRSRSIENPPPTTAGGSTSVQVYLI